ncbi:hypothetical protein BGW38_005666, partial [Lunasporangiospora selenospora]
MTANPFTLFCLVDGEANALSVKIDSTKTVDDLKKLIKDEKVLRFDDVAAAVLPKKDRKEISLTDVTSKELDETDDIVDVFPEALPKKTVHIIVHRPSTSFHNAFVRGDGHLPETDGPIRGLPRAWRRGFGIAPENRPSLLFMNLPDPSTPDSASRNLAAGSILDLVKDNNRHHIPKALFSPFEAKSGRCGKTRAVIELLSQHWGFYFNAADDDWGSSDMMTLYNTVRSYLKEVQAGSEVVDLENNNHFARKTTLLLFLSRLLVFKHCLSVPGSKETFTSARWALLQVCPHVLFKDIFSALFLKLLPLRHHRELDLSDFVRKVHEDAKDRLIKHGCLPKINDGTRLLVINDEAQFLGDQFNGSFQSTTSVESPRPLLSPILHAFRDIGQHELTLVTCGTGLSINTLFWVQSSGSGLKDSSTTFEYLEFPGWAEKESIYTYISRVRNSLQNEQSKQAWDELLSQEAVDMLFQKFAGRYRPAIAAVERIVECNDPGSWMKTIQDAEDRLVSWANRHIKGNLCYEINRLHDKHNKYKDQLVESIDSMLGLLMYQRCMFGSHDLILKEVDPQLVEHAFGRIKIIS